MRTRRAAAAALVIAVVCAASGVASALEGFGRERPTDMLIRRVDASAQDQVTLTVTPPRELPADANVTVQLDGRPADVQSFTGLEDPSTLATVVVLDTSSTAVDSVGLDTLRAAAEEAITSLPTGSQVGVVTSGGEATVVAPLVDDPTVAVAALQGLVARDGSARWDAMEEALTLLEDTTAIRTVIAIALSPDTASTATEGEVRTHLAEVNAAFFAVGPEAVISADLVSSVDAAGGAVVATTDADALASAVQEVGRVVGSQVTIVAAVPEGTADSGLVDASIAVGALTLDLAYPASRITDGHDGLTALQVEAVDADGGVLSGDVVKWAGAVLALVAVGLAAYAMVSVFASGDSTLKLALRHYGGDSVKEKAVEDDEPRSALGSSTMIQRAVELTENLADHRGVLSGVAKLLEQSDIPLRAGEAIFFAAVVCFLGGIFALVMAGPFAALAVIVGLALLQPGLVRYAVRRRRKKFVSQLPDTLTLTAGTLKAGYSLMQGVDAVAQQVDDPMGEELRRVVLEAQLGRALEDSLESTAERMGSDDFSWAVMAIRIQREVGGNLAELLLTVADTMTQRERLRREVAALTAEGRISAIVLGILPIAVGLAMQILNPEYTAVLFNDNLGRIILGGAIVMAVGGFLWMRKIITIEI